MNAQHQEVQVWLEKVFAGDDIPAYELNKRTVSLLYKLKRKNETKDADTQLIIDDLRQKADEYSTEAKRLENVTQNINLTVASLSQAGVMSLRTLASLALLLQINDATDSSYMLALQKLHDDLYKVQEARKREQRDLQHLLNKTKTAMLKHGNLKRALEVLEEQASSQKPETERRVKETGFLHTKAKEYRDKIQQCQDVLTKCGAEPSVYHNELVNKADALKKLQDDLVPLQQRLQSYQSLPPDVPLTKVKIEELRQQVAYLEEELSRKMDLMHM